MHPQVIQIHVEAPPKPALGAPCNGCGVCCLSEPCPVGILISRRRTGACKALVWVEADRVYRCGVLLLGEPPEGRAGRWPSRLWRGVWRWWARRVIAAGQGCDAAIEVPAPRNEPG